MNRKEIKKWSFKLFFLYIKNIIYRIKFKNDIIPTTDNRNYLYKRYFSRIFLKESKFFCQEARISFSLFL